MVVSTVQIDTLKKSIREQEKMLEVAKDVHGKLSKSIPVMEETLNTDKSRLAEMEKQSIL